MPELKKQTYLQGAAVLVAANFAVKIIGACFKIPLAAILHEEGMAVFNTAYSLYAILFVIATAGLPVAVSKMVAESVARRNIREAKRIFRAAALLLGIIGVAGMLALFLGARLFADLIVSPQSYFSILTVAPAIFFIAVSSAFRGYFQGHSTMTPTALSEVAEAVGKLTLGLLLAWLLAGQGVASASAGAVFGVTAGTFFSCAILTVLFLHSRSRLEHGIPTDAGQSVRPAHRIFLSLLRIAVPITIGAAVSSLTTIIDMVMIRQRLQTILITPELSNMLVRYFGLGTAEAAAGALMKVQPSEILYGSYSGFAIPLFNLPPTIVTSLSMSVVPAVSGALALGRKQTAQRLTESTIRITTLFALPCAVGMSLLASPILTAVYNNARSQTMLSILAVSVVFVCLVSVTTAVLQSAGYVRLPVYNMLAGGVVKVATNYFLVANPAIHINGAPISTVLCYATIAALNLICVIRCLHPSLKASEFVLKPLVCAAAMGFAAWGTYQLAAQWLAIPLPENVFCFVPQTVPLTPVAGDVRLKIILALGAAIAIGALVYFAALFAVGGIKRSDVEMLPKGRKIAALLDRFHLLHRE